MSPYGSLQQQQQQGKSNRQQQQQQQQQQQPSQAYSFNSRRKTNDQMMNNSLDHRSFLSDAFGSSAPAVSLFNTTNGGTEQLWRTNPPPPSQQQRTNDFIGLRSSPRETSDHHLLNYNRPSTNTITTHSSSSVRSNNGYFNIPENRRNITNGYNHPHPHQHQHHHHSSSSIDDLNDAMLPSSLNDLFTPTELHARSLRQQESSYEPWRVPFFEGTTAAINIPSGQHTSGSSGNEGSNSSYLQGQPEDDDEVQFFMEDDEAVTYDHMNNTKPTATTSSSSYNFPSLISLPST
ncbi:hypothetical protein BD770DRAFT_408861 [Pilaira anomala]|nr:hypothetical protein BD770DRAFT_408861 [Pilaira anomala]